MQLTKKIKIFIKLLFQKNSLDKIATLTGGDKKYGHYYIPIYEKHFKELKNRKIALLEIGVGGYDDKYSGGESLRMWSYYFKKSKIYGIDLFDKKLDLPKNVKVVRANQNNTLEINDFAKRFGSFDVIIDDGSHNPKDITSTFEILFRHLNENGIYVIEDTQTSYWPKFGGTIKDSSTRATSYFRDKTDGLNHSEFLDENYVPNYYDKNIVSISFYHNIIFIQKGNNSNDSIFVKNGILQL